MKELINEIDPHAFITVYDVAEVKGGNFKKRDIHYHYEEVGVPHPLLTIVSFVGKSIYFNNR